VYRKVYGQRASDVGASFFRSQSSGDEHRDYPCRKNRGVDKAVDHKRVVGEV